ncbi:hypothetical protein BDR26DRAFT_951860 [Obelidium mucronatum]|nr:hypothetical protein BDR26DRAFT_951860 [Obelidium mucronatum]
MSRPLRPHWLTNDAKNLMFLIKHQRPPGCEHVEAFVEFTTGTVLPSLDRKSTLVTLCIRKAEQLRAKDRNGSSNPYVTVTDRSDPNNHLTFESDSIERSVDPTWNFNISIVICEKSDIVISIWSKRSAGTEAFPDTYKLGKSKDSDSFLGQIVLLGGDLLGMFDSQVVENWYLLEKRSNKSSVSGRVLIEFKDVCRSGPPETIVEDVLQFSLSEVILAFEDTLRAFLGSHSQASREKSISDLEQLSKYWAIHTAGVELYASGGFEQLDVIMTEAREFSLASDASKKFQTLGLSIYHSTRRFISRTLQQPVDHYGATTLNSLVQIVQTLESFIENPLLLPHFGGASGHNLIEDCISKAIAERCCNTIESSKTVLDLIANIVEELKAFENCQSFNIPLLISNIYVGHIFGVLSCLESVSLDEVFKVYKETKRLASICYRIHPSLLEKLNLVELFRPYVEEFLRLSETNIKQWVQRSIDLDDFALQSTGHSSSVIDIFTSFQQQIDFIIDLSWPSEIDTRIFIGKMLENITAGIEEYIDLTKESIENDLKNHLPRSFSTSSASSQTQSPPGSPSQLKFKLKVRKEGPPVDPTERRISPVSCVKLSNIEAVVARFDSLLDSIPTSFKDSLHTSNGRIPSVVEAISPNPGPCTTGILTVLRADNLHPVKPYASKLTIQVCSLASGNCLGRTGRFHQKRRLSFGHSNSSAIPIVVKDSDLANGLQLQLIFHLPSTAGESDDLNTLIFGGGSGDNISRDSILMKATFALNSIVVDAINSGDDGVTFDVPVGGFTVIIRV